jgi:hypothetical protein
MELSLTAGCGIKFCVADPVFYVMRYYPVLKRPVHEADHTSISNVVSKNVCKFANGFHSGLFRHLS